MVVYLNKINTAYCHLRKLQFHPAVFPLGAAKELAEANIANEKRSGFILEVSPKDFLY